MKNTFRKGLLAAAAFIMSVTAMAGAAACDLFGGSLQVDSIAVDGSTLDTVYYVNDVVDFSNVSITVNYNDGDKKTVGFEDVEFFFGGEKITDFSVLTATAGNKKEVEIRYTEDGKTISYKFTITVTLAPNSGDGDEVTAIEVTGFAAPTSVAERASAVSSAQPFSADGDLAYESVFFTGYDTARLVGDDNAFKFLPILRLAEDNSLMTRFETNSTVSMLVEGEYVKLDKSGEGKDVVYSLNGETYVKEDSLNNEFDFTEKALGLTFKLEVLPSDAYLDYSEDAWTEFDPATVEVKIIDAFNIYDVKDLAIMENITASNDIRSFNGVGYWDAIKAEKGFTAEMVNSIKGVVLQNNLTVTAEDLPALFTYKLADDFALKYHEQGSSTNLTEDELKARGLTRTFLVNATPVGTTADGDTEETVIFQRRVKKGETFDVHGNYFSVDLSKMPLVAAFTATHNGVSTDPFNSSFFSTASFMKFIGNELEHDKYATPDIGGVVNINNLNAKGNAQRSNLECAINNNKGGSPGADKPVYAGGIIFMKSEYNTLNMTNVISRTFFLNYFAYRNALNNYTNVKAYESYSNSVWARGASTINITKSNFERAGGPLFILCDQSNNDDNIPQWAKVIVDEDSTLESLVTGNETWFVSNNANAYAAKIMDLNNLFAGFKAYGMMQTHKSIITQEGTSGASVNKLNLIAVTLLDGEFMTGVSQGYFKYGNNVIDRSTDPTVSLHGALCVQGVVNTVSSVEVFGYGLSIGETVDYSNAPNVSLPNAMFMKPSSSPFGFDFNDQNGNAKQDLSFLDANSKSITLHLPTLGVMLGYYSL